MLFRSEPIGSSYHYLRYLISEHIRETIWTWAERDVDLTDALRHYGYDSYRSGPLDDDIVVTNMSVKDNAQLLLDTVFAGEHIVPVVVPISDVIIALLNDLLGLGR